MASNNEAPSGDRWFGTQEAARYLGIHRSTLNLAVHRATLMPDRTTPGGHLRFSQETLDRFKSFLERGPVTSDERLIGPLHVLTDTASGLEASSTAKDVCQAAVRSILGSRMGIDAAAVVLVNRHSDPPRLVPITQAGFSKALMDELQRLFSGGVELATSHVLNTLKPEIVGDTERQELRSGTRRLVRMAGIRAYAVYPLMRGSQALGIFIVASTSPRPFTASDRLFLTALASELSLANYLEQYLTLTRNLIHAAMGRPAGPELSGGKPTFRLEGLRELFINQAAAEDICALGFDDGGALEPRHEQLRALAEGALARRTFLSQTWRLHNTVYSGMAVGVPLYDEHAVSVAVLWLGRRPRSPADQALLMVFAGACALASGRVRLETRGQRAAEGKTDA
jgi:excisionase family DNA binding protein